MESVSESEGPGGQKEPSNPRIALLSLIGVTNSPSFEKKLKNLPGYFTISTRGRKGKKKDKLRHCDEVKSKPYGRGG